MMKQLISAGGRGVNSGKAMRRGLCLAALLAAGAGVPSARATLNFSTDFETNTLGNLAGQGTWLNQGNANNVVVENTFAEFGTKAVRLTSSGVPAGQEIGTYEYNNYTPAANELVLLSLDVYRQSGGSPSSFDLWGFTSTGYAAYVRLDYHAGNAIESFPGSTISIAPVTWTNDTWNEVGLRMNFTTHTYDVLWNNVAVLTNQAFNSTSSTASTLSGGLFELTNPAASTDTTYVDNFVVKTVPEPGSGFLALIGGLGMVGMRMRSRRR